MKMRHTFLIYMMIMCVTCASEKQKSYAESIYFYSEEEFSKWLFYYYTDPKPETIPAAIKFYSNSYLYDDNKFRNPLSGFFAACFQKDRLLMTKSFKEISANGTEEAKILLLNSLWLTDHKESREFIIRAYTEWNSPKIKLIIEKMRGRPPVNILDKRLYDPSDIGLLWAYFLATGDEEPVIRICQILEYEGTESKKASLLVDKARWSLVAFGMTHDKVYALCDRELEYSEGSKKIHLEEVLEEIKKGSSGSPDINLNIFMMSRGI